MPSVVKAYDPEDFKIGQFLQDKLAQRTTAIAGA